MPHRQKVGGRTSLPVLYNIERAVGPVCPNRREDVMLVQYMLRAFFSATMPGRGGWIPHARLKVDGVCGPITEEYISAFQHRAASIVAASLDNRMHPATEVFGPRHGFHFAIILLNTLLHRTQPILFQNLPWAADMPADVKALLTRPEAPIGRFVFI